MQETDTAALDHVGIAAPDLAAAALAYERLGFRLTPTARQSGPLVPGGPVTSWGSANRCAMLRRGYIELLGIVAPGLYDNELGRFLARYAGIHVLALAVADAAAALRRLRTAGIATPGIRPLARPAGDGIARFKRVPLDAAPEGRIQLIEHETRELLWRPELLEHANRATALEGTVLCVADLGEAATRFQRLTGVAPTGGPGTAVFSLTEGRLVLCDPSRLGAFVPRTTPPTLPWFAASVVATDDGNAAAAALLARNAVPHERLGDRIVVPPHAACGAACVFLAGPAIWPEGGSAEEVVRGPRDRSAPPPGSNRIRRSTAPGR